MTRNNNKIDTGDSPTGLHCLSTDDGLMENYSSTDVNRKTCVAQMLESAVYFL